MQDYQFSIDIHLLVGWEKNAPGFYERAKEREVWRGKNREDRFRPRFGHSPNNTHIHLDVRPVKLNRDE
jgi:hypothetical protein